jgi:hypothetical protein
MAMQERLSFKKVSNYLAEKVNKFLTAGIDTDQPSPLYVSRRKGATCGREG